MITASCHCNAVRIEIAELPPELSSCNCSVCWRYGALWARTTRDAVRLVADPEALVGYCWGDRTISFVHCRRCGCLTHYEGIVEPYRSRFVVNARMLPRQLVASLRVRQFDGADSWEYLD